MNEKYEFQVGDLVRLKSVEEILALGFWFNELGGISYPNKKEGLLLSDELKHCGKEFVVRDIVDITAHNHITLDSPNSSVRIVNVCPSVLELVEVEVEVEDEDEDEDEETTFKSGDRVRIKQVDELLELGYTIDAYGYLRYPNNCVFLNKYQMRYCGREFTVVDHEVAGIYVIESLDRETLFDFVLESAIELIEDELEDEWEYEEDWISKPTLEVNPGDMVRIKTHEELIETGWTFYGDNYFHSIDGESIVSGMHKFLGKVYTVEKIVEGDIKLEEDYEYWNWTSYMIAEVVEENTYRDEEGNPFDPHSDYTEEEDYQPYCAVVDEVASVSNDTYEPTTWDKERIQRGFENLEMYHKGYTDGFQRASELMKKEFGVE